MAKKKQEAEVYYVQIPDAVALRKTILLTSRDIIQLLHKFELFKKRREFKKELLQGIKNKVIEINELAGKLKLDLPSVKFKDDIEKEEKLKKVEPAAKKELKDAVREPVTKEDSALTELENSLAEIENKLQRMME